MIRNSMTDLQAMSQSGKKSVLELDDFKTSQLQLPPSPTGMVRL